MRVYLQSLGYGVWNAVINDYIPPKRVRTTSQKESNKNNSREIEAIVDGLPQPIKEKIGPCILAKELWVKLEKLYSVEQREEARFSLFKNESDDEESCTHKEDQRSKTIYKKKNVFSMEDSKDEEISENEEKLFMETVTSEDDSDVEGEVDLMVGLINAV